MMLAINYKLDIPIYSNPNTIIEVDMLDLLKVVLNSRKENML